MTRYKKIEVPLVEFAGREINSTEDLLTAIQEARKRSGIIKSDSIKISVGNSCKLDINAGYSCLGATISIHKKNHFEMLDVIRNVVPLLQEEHHKRPGDPMIVSLRHGAHAAQFINGHLEKSGDEMLPMCEIPDRYDQTMIRTLRTLKNSAVDNNVKNLTSQNNLRTHDVTVGLSGYVGDIFNGGNREKVARALDFNIVSKTSEGIVPNGGNDEEQVCLATRLCVHSEEITANAVVDKAVETYAMMKKLEKDPSIVMGLGYGLEIHANSESISIENNDANQELFSKLLNKLLESVGVENLSTATIQYEEEAGKSLIRKWANVRIEHAIDSILDSAENLVNGCGNYITRNKAKINAGLILASIPLILIFLLVIGQSLFESLTIMIPTMVIVAFLAFKSEEDRWIERIGEEFNVFIYYLLIFLSILTALNSFALYVAILKIISVAVIIFTIAITFMSKERGKKINNWINFLFEKAIEDRLVMAVLTILGIVLGIVMLITSGILILPAIALVVLAISVAALLNIKFWREIKRDRQRQLDRFFVNFREKRPDMPEACEIRFEVTKCKKLRNPFRGIPTKLMGYLKDKFPETLTPSGAKKASFNLVSGKWINGVIDFLR